MHTSIGTNRVVILLLAALVCACQSALFAAASEPELGPNEVKMGEEGVAEITKEYKLSDNAADLKRVRTIGEKMAAVANAKEVPAIYGSPTVTPFKYTFDIVEDPDVNAFSLPGGHIYVHRGLLDFVQSDQELAGVIAHEVVHAAHHHMVYLLKKQASLDNAVAIALLATMIGGARNSDMGNVLMGVQLLRIARLSGYGMQAERDADNAAALYMRDASYNPVGLLTFMERLAKRIELVDYGIYRSHPLDAERVQAAKQVIAKLGLPINRRDTTKAVSAEVKVEKVDGTDRPEVLIGGTVIYVPAPTAGKTSAQIAKETADRINKALDADVKMYEIKIDAAGGGVIARNQAVMTVSDADAKLMGKTPGQVAQIAGTAIRQVVWQQMVDTIH